jgi:hypothetical protein
VRDDSSPCRKTTAPTGTRRRRAPALSRARPHPNVVGDPSARQTEHQLIARGTRTPFTAVGVVRCTGRAGSEGPRSGGSNRQARKGQR